MWRISAATVTSLLFRCVEQPKSSILRDGGVADLEEATYRKRGQHGDIGRCFSWNCRNEGTQVVSNFTVTSSLVDDQLRNCNTFAWQDCFLEEALTAQSCAGGEEEEEEEWEEVDDEEEEWVTPDEGEDVEWEEVDDEWEEGEEEDEDWGEDDDDDWDEEWDEEEWEEEGEEEDDEEEEWEYEDVEEGEDEE